MSRYVTQVPTCEVDHFPKVAISILSQEVLVVEVQLLTLDASRVFESI